MEVLSCSLLIFLQFLFNIALQLNKVVSLTSPPKFNTMLHLPEIRIGNFFELPSFPEGNNRMGKVTEISQKQVLINRKSFNLDRLIPIFITEEILLHSGFTQFGWLKGFSVFQCDYFKCTLNSNGVNLFGDNVKNLKPVKYFHELQNLYFDFTGEELEIDSHYIKSAKTEMV